MNIDVPIPCPRCGGSMYSTSYDTVLSVLKRRVWHICKECNYEADVDVFKSEILRR